MKKYIICISIIIVNFTFPIITAGQSYNDIYVETLGLDSFNIHDWVNNTRSNDFRVIVEHEKSNNFTRSGWTHDSYKFEYKGIPLEFASIKVHKKNGVITSLNGNLYTDLSNINVTPSVSKELAFHSALKFMGAKRYSWEYHLYNKVLLDTTLRTTPQAELVICPIYKTTKERIPCLTYKFNIMSIEPFRYMSVYVDAHSGDVVHTNSLVNYSLGTAHTWYSGTQTINTTLINNLYYLHDLDRGIYTYNNHMGLSNDINNAYEITDDDNDWDFRGDLENYIAADAHWGAMMTYDYFYYTFGRNSIDNKGMDINGYVNCNIYQDEFNSTYYGAAWVQLNNGGGYAAYGEGAPYGEPGPYVSLDIVAHELGHGITRSTANLEYSRELGAINEALSDIWGACVENYVNTEHYVNIEKNIWLIGEDLFTHNKALSSMSNPRAYNMPVTYGLTSEGWETYPSDILPYSSNNYCGVHTNCSVMDYWFYLLSVGGSGINGNNYVYSVDGIGIDNAALIVYNALCNYFTSSTDYEQAANLTHASAIELFGLCSSEVQSVTDAWRAVGVPIDEIRDTLDVFEEISIGGKGFFADSLINVFNLVDSGATASYISYRKIRFLPNFRAEKGSRVFARISTCDDNNAPSPPLMRAPAYHNTSDSENSNSMQPFIAVAPNPVMDILHIIGLNGDKSGFAIYDAMGKMIKNGTIFAPFQVSVADLPKGTYTLCVNTLGHNYYVRFIKE